MVLTPRFWYLIAFGILLAIPAAFNSSLLYLMIAYDLALVGVAIVDLLMTPRQSSYELTREHANTLSIGAANLITLTLQNKERREVELVLRDEPPPTFTFDKREFKLTLPARSAKTLKYNVFSNARGTFRFRDAFIRSKSPLGLWWGSAAIPASSEVKVYPNVLAIREYDLLKQTGHLREMGIRRTRLRGVGSEFESLREYTSDDSFRRIDWKATARRGKPIVREYEAERSQSVFLVIDAGRHMMAQVENILKLDHVLNAALMLAYACSASDDRVGLLTFDDSVRRYIPPKRGRAQVELILDTLHGIDAEPVEPNYPAALAYLSRRWAKRSLIVVFTDLQETESSAGLIQGLVALSRHHLCLCVTVSDPGLNKLANASVTDERSVYNKVVALQVSNDRQAAIRHLRQRGIRVVDSEPETLSVDLVNLYHEVKAQSLI